MTLTSNRPHTTAQKFARLVFYIANALAGNISVEMHPLIHRSIQRALGLVPEARQCVLIASSKLFIQATTWSDNAAWFHEFRALRSNLIRDLETSTRATDQVYAKLVWALVEVAYGPIRSDELTRYGGAALKLFINSLLNVEPQLVHDFSAAALKSAMTRVKQARENHDDEWMPTKQRN